MVKRIGCSFLLVLFFVTIVPCYAKGDRIPAKKNAKVRNIDAIEIYDPESDFDKLIDWDNLLPGKQDNKALDIKFKIKLKKSIKSIKDVTFKANISFCSRNNVYLQKDIEINEKNARMSADNKEILVTVHSKDLGDLKAIRENNDKEEKTRSCSFEAESSTNFNDSDMFDSLCEGRMSERISARATGNETDKPAGNIPAYTPKANMTYFKAAGAIYLKISAGEKEVRRLVKNQANWFYVSAHGSWNGSVKLDSAGSFRVFPSDINNEWKSVNRVYFSLCAALHIALDRNDSKYSGGLDWVGTGPKYFFGYRDIAPADYFTRWNNHFTADIIEKAFSYERNRAVPPEQAWLQGNNDCLDFFFHDNPKVYNSCAIVAISPNVLKYCFWKEDPISGQYIYTERYISH